MKRILLFTVIAGVAAATLPLHSQAPVLAPAVPALPAGTALEQLKALRDQNVKLLEQQAATLQKLETLEKDVQLLKVIAGRS